MSRAGTRSRATVLAAIVLLLVAGCAGGPVLANPPAARPAPAATATPSTRPTDPVPVVFPRDDAAHDRLTEWWYYTGHLRDVVSGDRFGFEFVVFRAERGDFPVSWASHLAITDETHGRFLYGQRTEIGPSADLRPAGGFDLSLVPDPTHAVDAANPAWRMTGLGGHDRLAATMTGAESTAAGSSGSLAIDLGLTATKPPALHDRDGWIDFGAGGGSYYYSRTRMSAGGTITLDGRALTVDGEAWFDHQWGDFIAVGGGGWDWFALNLADGSDLTLSLVRDRTGTPSLVYGTSVDREGTTSHLPADAFAVTVTGHWTSPKTGAVYPAGWHVEIPGQGLAIDLTPTVAAQELDTRATTGVVYWEGSQVVRATRHGTPIAGEAYVELTGYAPAPLPRVLVTSGRSEACRPGPRDSSLRAERPARYRCRPGRLSQNRCSSKGIPVDITIAVPHTPEPRPRPMPTRGRVVAASFVIVALAIAGLVGGCTSGNAGSYWTYTAPSTPPAARGSAIPAPSATNAMADMPGMAGVGSGADATTPLAAGGTIEIHAFDLGFRPSVVAVAAAGTYAVTFSNDGATTHDLTFADGTKLSADSKQTVTGSVTVPAGGLTFLCSIPGHSAAGMTGSISVGAGGSTATAPSAAPATAIGSAPVADPNAAAYVLRDPVAPSVMAGTVHDIEMPIIERDMTVAKGFVVHVWTFGGTVPGPVIRVHLGDTVNVHLTNQTPMSHSIDFHASETAMNHQMVEIKPGDTFTYTFKANYAGVWMYHCGTAPALDHIANGMFGMVIVEPKGGLPKVDKELFFVQSEWYLGAQGQPIDYAKAASAAPAPDFVVFNGIADQYKDNPVSIPTKGRVRVFVLDTGPSFDSSFHVVGTIFDTVTKEGVQLVKGNAGGWGSQAVDLSPAQGAIIEFSPAEDGMYPFVTHAFNLVVHGAIGIMSAGDGDPGN